MIGEVKVNVTLTSNKLITIATHYPYSVLLQPAGDEDEFGSRLSVFVSSRVEKRPRYYCFARTKYRLCPPPLKCTHSS